MDPKSHIIHNVTVNLECNPSHVGSVHQIDVGQIIKDVFDKLELDFDLLSHDQKINIDEMSIDLEVSNVQDDTLKRSITSALEKIFRGLKTEEKVEISGSKMLKAKRWTSTETLLYFIQSGQLPWTEKKVSLCVDEYQNQSIQSELIEPLITILKNNTTAIQRLVHQFKQVDLIQLMTILTTPQIAKEIEVLSKAIALSSKKYSKVFDIDFRLNQIVLEAIIHEVVQTNSRSSFNSVNWKNTFKTFIAKSIKSYPTLDVYLFEELILETNNKKLMLAIEMVRDIIITRDFTIIESSHEMGSLDNQKRKGQHHGNSTKDVEIDSLPERIKHKYQKQESSVSELKDGDTIQVPNAGIILLHPFIPSFFEKVGLVDKGDFISKECQQRAICLLHYIATGSLEFEEQLLTFPKFLCHYEMEETIPVDLPISPFEKDEVDKLIEAVLTHWTGLKGTTIHGLRGNFLTRKGALQKDGNDRIIHVEHQTADILLSSLPWSLNYAKWSWLPQLLTIKWS